MSLNYIADTEIPSSGRNLTMVCCPEACRLQASWTWRLMMVTPTYLTTNPSTEWPQTFSPSFLNWDTGFWWHWSAVAPFAWQSLNAIFPLQQNSVPKIWCGTSVLTSWAFSIIIKISLCLPHVCPSYLFHSASPLLYCYLSSYFIINPLWAGIGITVSKFHLGVKISACMWKLLAPIRNVSRVKLDGHSSTFLQTPSHSSLPKCMTVPPSEPLPWFKSLPLEGLCWNVHIISWNLMDWFINTSGY